MTVAAASGAKHRLESLDVIRFLAAVSVMVYHFTYRFSSPDRPSISALETVTRHGYLGVEVFFILSGFVILWSARTRTATAFVRARVLRLYPEFWIAVLVSATVFNLLPGASGRGFTAGEVLVNLTMVPNFFGIARVDDVYWTLLVELKFYFLVWVLILARQVPVLERWLVAWIAVSALGLVVELPGVVRSLTIFPYGTLFAAGGIFYLIFDSGWTMSRAMAIAVATPTAAMLAVETMSDFIDPAHITTSAKVATIGVMVTAFGAFATLRSHVIATRFGGAAALAGALTYPLYLLHNVGKAIFLRGLVPGPEWLLVAAAIVCSLVLSYAVMRVGTGPLQAALRRIVDAALARTARLGRGGHGRSRA